MVFKDLTGQKFGKLTVIRRGESRITPSGKPRVCWVCRCDCGNETIVDAQKLKVGHTKSCGCAIAENKGQSFVDLTGQRFNRLTVVRFLEKGERTTRAYNWLCRCDCGNTVRASADKLNRRLQQSCGCLKEEMKPRLGELTRKYKYSNKRLYSQYKAMIDRVFNVNRREYKNYGGRGISVCEEWLGESGYDRFAEWALSVGYDSNAERGVCTLDRADVNKDYSPDNCRWVTNQTQQNNRRDNIRLEYRGESHTMAEWSRILDIPYTTLAYHCRKKERSIQEVLDIHNR